MLAAKTDWGLCYEGLMCLCPGARWHLMWLDSKITYGVVPYPGTPKRERRCHQKEALLHEEEMAPFSKERRHLSSWKESTWHHEEEAPISIKKEHETTRQKGGTF